MKKILTFEDLVKFCQDTGLRHFSSKENGYQLAVSVPATIETFEKETEYQGLMRLKIKMFHIGKNRNGSYISKEAATKAMSTIPNRPVLASIHQLDNGEFDFSSHDMVVSFDEYGEEKVEYIESQVGSFSSEAPFWEYDDENDKDFICAYAYIPREYTKAAEIIERKNGTKNSCELFINEMAYSSKEKCIELKDFYVAGSTLLGSTKDGTEVQEGMLGSRADIADFAGQSSNFELNTDLNKVIAELKSSVDKITKTLNNTLGGAQKMDKLNELLVKYEKTIEDLPDTYEWESLSDEELEQHFSELFDADASADTADEAGIGGGAEDFEEGSEGGASGTDTQEGKADNGGDGENGEGTTDEGEPENFESDPEVPDNTPNFSVTMNGVTREFAISLNDKIQALTELVNSTYAEGDNTYYCVQCYDDYVIMIDTWRGNAYKRMYDEPDEGTYLLVGERVPVFCEWLTQDELDALNLIRKKYDQMIEERIEAERQTVLNDPAYEDLFDTDEFIALKKEAGKFSAADLSIRADALLGQTIKKKKNGNKVGIGGFDKAPKRSTPYGSLFN